MRTHITSLYNVITLQAVDLNVAETKQLQSPPPSACHAFCPPQQRRLRAFGTLPRQTREKPHLSCALHAIARSKRPWGHLDHNLGCCTSEARTGAAPRGIEAARAQNAACVVRCA
jgi:hypothetical protein